MTAVVHPVPLPRYPRGRGGGDGGASIPFRLRPLLRVNLDAKSRPPPRPPLNSTAPRPLEPGLPGVGVMLRWLSPNVGVALVVLALTDVFLTVLYVRIGTAFFTEALGAGL